MSVLRMLRVVFDVRISNLYEQGQRDVIIVLHDEELDADGNFREKINECK